MGEYLWMLLWLITFVPALGLLWKMLGLEDPRIVRFHSKISARSPISDLEFMSYFWDTDHIDAKIAIRVRALFAEHAELPAEQLLPDDVFPSWYYFDDLDGDDFVKRLETEFAVTIPASDLRGLEPTIRSCSNAFSTLSRRATEG